jgi:hypothetical protein
VAGNLLDRQFTAEKPNQRWVGDTTEFVIGESGKLYLAAILDLYSRFIVGWAVSVVNDRHLAIKALEKALQRRCPEAGLLHHSDQLLVGSVPKRAWSARLIGLSSRCSSHSYIRDNRPDRRLCGLAAGDLGSRGQMPSALPSSATVASRITTPSTLRSPPAVETRRTRFTTAGG